MDKTWFHTFLRQTQTSRNLVSARGHLRIWPGQFPVTISKLWVCYGVSGCVFTSLSPLLPKSVLSFSQCVRASVLQTAVHPPFSFCLLPVCWYLCRSTMEAPQAEGLAGHSPPLQASLRTKQLWQEGESCRTKHDPSGQRPGGTGSGSFSELLRQGHGGLGAPLHGLTCSQLPLSLLRGHFSLSLCLLCSF